MRDLPKNVFFNGVNASTGKFLVDPLTPQQLAQHLPGRGRGWSPATLIASDERRSKTQMDTEYGVNKNDLSQAGWGVAFSQDSDPAIREALAPLLEMREEQAGDLYLDESLASEATHENFLADHGATHGKVSPDKLPYYLLLVGPPKTIPFDFQYELDVDHAVGRLDLETPDDYAAYAQSVVDAETNPFEGERRATFFGVENEDDLATETSWYYLVNPLTKDFERHAKPNGWQVDRIFREEARKRRLQELLESPSTRGNIVFTASHGIGFDYTDAYLRGRQGAILCADWPGPKQWSGPVLEDHYFSAEDLSPQATVEGSIFMAFACFSAGTPKMDSFYHHEGRRSQIAPEAFTARLPQRLLAKGALAFIGHIDRAWTYSFYWPEAGVHRVTFTDYLLGLLQGQTVGAAMESFAARFASLAVRMVRETTAPDPTTTRKQVIDRTGLWTAYNDARSYVTLGDPAVRLPSAQRGTVSRQLLIS